MSSALALQSAIPALSMDETELCSVLQASIYPGAKLESIKLAIGYCRAAGLDPMQKPVHIVPMRVKKPGTKDDYEWRDVVMPGVGLYRVQAARSGCYAGVSEPEFGPMQTLRLGEFELSYPEWCRVTVRRFNPATGQIFDFTAVEYWLENYATKARDSKVPNEMWQRRPRGQLAKCAEAQALRKAFPEIGAAPTAEEMEGKEIDVDGVIVQTPQTAVRTPQPRSAKMRAAAAAAEDATTSSVDQAGAQQAPSAGCDGGSDGGGDDPAVGEGERAFLRKKAEAAGRDLDALCRELGVSLAGLTKSGFQRVKAALAQ